MGEKNSELVFFIKLNGNTNKNVFLPNIIYMHFLRIRYYILVAIWSLFFTSYSQELPPIQNFSPNDYKAENQNWGIAQALNKNIYIANNKGLLEYNGASWTIYKSPNNTIFRSVAVKGNRIYTGCYKEFGYWQKNKLNTLEYKSLSTSIQDKLLEDEQFWKIITYDKWVLFQSLQQIYMYDTSRDTFRIISTKNSLSKSFKVKGQVFFQKMKQGLFSIKRGKPILVSDSDIVKKNIIINIFDFDEKILIQTQEKGFYLLDGKKLTKWKVPFNSTLDKINVYSSIRLKDNTFVLGTISQGIFHIDKEGQLINHINQEKGLQNNTVLSLFEDSDKNVWVGLDKGISIINLKSAFKVYEDVIGNLGTVYTSMTHNGFIYLGTNQGLFYKQENINEKFKFISGTKGQVWSLNVLYNTLFCGHNSGTFLINNGKAKLISSELGTWNIKKIVGNPNLLIQGNYNGLHILEKKNNQWTYRNKIKGFDISSRYFEIFDNSIFVNHEYKGVFKLELKDDFSAVKKYEIKRKVTGSVKSTISMYNKELLYFDNSGFYKFDKKSKDFRKYSILTNSILNTDTYLSGKMIVSNNENMWVFTNENIVLISPGKFANQPKIDKIALPIFFRGNIRGEENIMNLKGDTYLLGTSNGYLLIDLQKYKEVSYRVKIEKITKGIYDDKETILPLKPHQKLTLDENSITFSYSVPVFEKFSRVQYQYKLDGIHKSWSHWSEKSSVSFDNIPFGTYHFEVRAKMGNHLSENIASFEFTVNRPWYLSYHMIIIYLILLITFFVVLHYIYNRYYSIQRRKLMLKKQREMMLIQLEKDKTIMKLKNENLQVEVKNKTQELAISTMNIVKKNELLNTIKKGLVSQKENTQIKKVLKIIDENIKDKDDWKVFQKAFNNTDRDFLKKIKQLHPKLTPTDLKLCAYLRMNLSSKEIAPLLNISIRSVEIKRYRLRKKMDLTHKKNLVEYILEI